MDRFYTNVFSWEPYEYQWWITRFNPQYVNKVNMKRLISIGCVDFTGYDDLYLSLKNEIKKDEKKQSM